MATQIQEGATTIVVTSPVDDERARLDAEIARLETEARHLRRKRNLLSVPGRFPTELLLHIFAFLRDIPELPLPPSSSSPKNVYRRQPNLDWLRVTRVCSRWRTAALESPHLWTRLALHDHVSHDLASLCLSRSGNWPIALELCRLSSNVSLAHLGLAESARIRELHLDEVDDAVLTACEADLQRPMPLLSKFSAAGPLYAASPTLPVQNFLGRRAPHLTNVSIHRADTGWLSRLPNRAGILHLSLGVQDLLPTLHLLTSLSNLRTLDLDAASKRALSTAPFPDDAPRPQLPCLKRVTIRSDVRGAAAFLGQLDAPALTDVDMRVLVRYDPATLAHREHARRLGASLAQLSGPREDGCPPRWLLEPDRLEVRENETTLRGRDTALVIRFEWTGYPNGADATASEWLYHAAPSVLNGIELERICAVEWVNPSGRELEDYWRWRGKPWRKVAPLLSGVHTLSLCMEGAPVPLLVEDAESEGAPLFPALRTVRVEEDDGVVRRWVFGRWRRGARIEELGVRVLEDASMERELKMLVGTLKVGSANWCSVSPGTIAEKGS